MVLKKLEGLLRISSEPYVFFGMFVFVTNLFTIPQFVQHRVCHNKHNATICAHLASANYSRFQDSVQKETAHWMAVITLTSLIPSIFILIILGPFSDTFGKKRTMVVTPLISLLQSITYLIISQLKGSFSPGWCVAGALLSGFFGEMQGVYALSAAYIASITTLKNRTLRISIMEGFVFMASCLACLSTGLILGKLGFTAVFVTTAIINIMNFLYVALLLPEEKHSVEEEENIVFLQGYGAAERKMQEREMTDFQDSFFQKFLKACNPRKCINHLKTVVSSNGNGKEMLVLLAFLACALIATMGENYIGVLFLKHRPFNLSPSGIGYLVAYRSFIQAMAIIFLTSFLQKYFHFTDHMFIILGFCLQAVYYIVLGVSVSTLMLYLIQAIGTPVHLPVLRSAISKQVDPNHHGTALAIAEIVDASSSLVTSLLSNIIYAETVKIYPGFAFFMLSVIATTALVGSVALYIKHRRTDRDDSANVEHASLLADSYGLDQPLQHPKAEEE